MGGPGRDDKPRGMPEQSAVRAQGRKLMAGKHPNPGKPKLLGFLGEILDHKFEKTPFNRKKRDHGRVLGSHETGKETGSFVLITNDSAVPPDPQNVRKKHK